MPYAHASPDERCSRCNDIAARIVGTQALCLDHFANIVNHCRHAARRNILTPRDISPDGFTAWSDTLRHGINIGIITDNEAAHAWNTAKDFAA